ncbi:MAG: hypothetical protein H5T44_06195 [Thermoplasmatales archaeon]|nr:hypothetical protein [Thermoplasmatales archaeon]
MYEIKREKMEGITNQSIGKEQLVRGFIFNCSNKTEKECLEKMLFGADKIYGPVVIRIRKGDLLFLVNREKDVIYGVFKATTDGGFKIEFSAWKGRYPYQVRVQILGEIIELKGADEILRRFGIAQNTPLYWKKNWLLRR